MEDITLSIVDDCKVIPVSIEDAFAVISLLFGEGLADIVSLIDIVEFIMTDWFTLTVIMELGEGVADDFMLVMYGSVVVAVGKTIWWMEVIEMIEIGSNEIQ